MEKVTLFENLLNATDSDGNRARRAAVTNFAALMGVDRDTVFDLLTMYRANKADVMIMDAFLDCICAADAARVLDAAGLQSVLVNLDCPDAVKTVCAFMSAGWQACHTVIGYDDGDRPAMRLTRA